MKNHIEKLQHKINKSFNKEQNKNIVLTMLLIISITFLIYVFNNDGIRQASYNSELKFAENSNDFKIKGQIFPASCESYPTIGQPHFIGDSKGNCACPAQLTLTNVNFKACTNGQYDTSSNCITPTANGCAQYSELMYWWVKTTDSCPVDYPTVTTKTDTYPLCQTTVLPAAVNIHF